MRWGTTLKHARLMTNPHSNCRGNGGAPTGWAFSRPLITLSITTETFQAVALTPVIAGPNYRTVGMRGVRQSTMLHLQGHTAHRAKHNANQDCSLQELGWPLTSTGGTSQKGHSKSQRYSTVSKVGPSQIQCHLFIANVLKYYAALARDQDLTARNFLRSSQNWELFDSLDF